MKHSIYTSYDELPLMLSVAEVAAVLGISRAGAYELAHSDGFPALKIGSRIVVPRDKFLAWIDANSGSKTAPLQLKNRRSIFCVPTKRLSKTVKPINAARETAMGSRSPAGPRRLGTATRMSASLFRRLSAFFGSTSDQGPKAAKYAVLTPGRTGFPNRAKRSEGSDSAPIQNAPCFAV